MKPIDPSNVYALGAALIEACPVDAFAFQVIQHIGDNDKAGMPYDIDWFTLGTIRDLRRFAKKYSDRRIAVKKALDLLLSRSDAFELCSPSPTRDLVITPNSVSWLTLGVAHERLV
jgi:hypothetical protein